MITQIQIEVLLNERIYELGVWPAVPRKGDAICFNNREITAHVDGVIWNTADKTVHGECLLVSLLCTDLQVSKWNN